MLADRREAEQQADAAEELIRDTGYHRRDGALAAIRAGVAALG